MDVNAIILESDAGTAQKFIETIESSAEIKCISASTLEEAKTLLKTYANITYLFCVYDVSSNSEQLRERDLAEYVWHNHPNTQIYSFGSIQRPEVTFSERKVLLVNKSDINAIARARQGQENYRKLNFSINAGAFKGRGIHGIH
jgi:hypothetical protein